VVERRVPEFRLSLAMARYLALVQLGSVQCVLAMVGAEGFLLYGALTLVGAFLKNVLGMSYSAHGLVLACFGIGGLSYAHFVKRLGERGMMFCGGSTVAWSIAAAMASSGRGFRATMQYRLHYFPEAGNSYKLALMLTLCGQSFEPVWTDFGGGITRMAKWRARVNAMGEIPMPEG